MKELSDIAPFTQANFLEKKKELFTTMTATEGDQQLDIGWNGFF